MENVTIIKKDMKKINKIEKNFSKLKLRENTIPNHSHGNNLRNLLTKTTWDKLRKKIKERDKNQCVICGDKSPKTFHCHEEFIFDYENQIQLLDKLMTLCPHCHANKHIASKIRFFNRGEFSWGSMRRLILHWFIVNFWRRIKKRLFYFVMLVIIGRDNPVNFLKKGISPKLMEKLWDEYRVLFGKITIKKNIISWKVDLNKKKIKKISKNFDIEVKYKKNLKKLELNRGLKIHKNKDNILIRECPNCRSDKLEKFDELSEGMGFDGMTEGEYAEYLAGTWGTIWCQQCGEQIDFG